MDKFPQGCFAAGYLKKQFIPVQNHYLFTSFNRVVHRGCPLLSTLYTWIRMSCPHCPQVYPQLRPSFPPNKRTKHGAASPKIPPPGCESIAETSQVSTKMLPPGGSCHGVALKSRPMTEEEFGRQPENLQKQSDLLAGWLSDPGGGLQVTQNR